MEDATAIPADQGEFLQVFGEIAPQFNWRLINGALRGTAQRKHHFVLTTKCTFCPVTAFIWTNTGKFFKADDYEKAVSKSKQISEALALTVVRSVDNITTSSFFNSDLRQELLQKAGIGEPS